MGNPQSPSGAMISIPWNPERKQLRQFAGIWFPAFCALVGWIVGKKTGHWGAVEAAWMACGLVAVAGLIHPPLIRPVFVGLILLTFPIGWVISHLLLGAIFYLLVTPIGLVLRLTGHDPLGIRKPSGDTNWKPAPRPASVSKYLQQN